MASDNPGAVHSKTEAELRTETQKHKKLADQLSLFDASARPLKPCPVQFVVKWRDQDGKNRSHECDDWETSAAYNRFEKMYGSTRAIQTLQEKYADYFISGLVLGFSTHSRRNIEFGTQNQWLLVGIIRLDETHQPSLDL